ncbi:hypothetical protein NQ314_012452 [Rhamnusium bicolor]|uniref:Uncharacterized protein n=1 Tax=Rhamnusium bicolor TaxID=1586634 RepID=A0AAV8XBM8_9CUCU|nr:hypothetical protein NQ314_012452 [Rhamnusium bicolor]
MADFKKKWVESNTQDARFLKRNRVWPETYIEFTKYCSENKKKGRPEKTFENISERSKRQKTKKLQAQHSLGELSYAAQMSLRSSGQIDASKVIKDVTTTSPKRALKYRTAYKQLDIPQTRKLQGTEALSIFIDAALIREQYNKIRRKDLSRFPSYKKIQLAKKECYPKKGSNYCHGNFC